MPYFSSDMVHLSYLIRQDQFPPGPVYTRLSSNESLETGIFNHHPGVSGEQ